MYKVNYPRQHAREYETIYIMKPDLSQDQASQIAERINKIIDQQNGKLEEMQIWGKRLLAYPIKKNQKGIMVYLKYAGFPGVVEEIERNFKMIENVMRFMTVRINDSIDIDQIKIEDGAIKMEKESFVYDPEFDSQIKKDDNSNMSNIDPKKVRRGRKRTTNKEEIETKSTESGEEAEKEVKDESQDSEKNIEEGKHE